MASHTNAGRQLMAVAVLLLIAGCSSQSAGAPQQLGGGDALPSAPAEEPQAGDGETGGQPQRADFAPIEQRIVKTGEVGLEVDDVGTVLA